MNLGSLLLYVGALLMGSTFIFFRKSGVPLTKAGPVWKAKESYTPLGVGLFYLSILTGGVGIVLTYLLPSAGNF